MVKDLELKMMRIKENQLAPSLSDSHQSLLLSFQASGGAFNLKGGLMRVLLVTLFVAVVSSCYAGVNYTNEQIADAIYLAEGGSKTRHPYGILTKYKTTTPRQACINTIEHARKDWDGKGDFIDFLGSRYCPVGASNDPTNLNKHWIRNVNYFLWRSE